MVRIEAFLETEHEADASKREEHECRQSVMAEKDSVQQRVLIRVDSRRFQEGTLELNASVELDPALPKGRLPAPSLRDCEELDREVEVPVDILGLDLDLLFLCAVLLQLHHLRERDSHQDVDEDCCGDEADFEQTKHREKERVALEDADLALNTSFLNFLFDVLHGTE